MSKDFYGNETDIPIYKQTVTVPRLQYEDLLEDSLQLAHLEALGVDNWSGYSHYSTEEEEE